MSRLAPRRSYFQAAGVRNGNRTSNHTLAGVQLPGYAQVAALLARGPTAHPRELRVLALAHEQHFGAWRAQLRGGFSLMLHGFGSKKVRCLLAA